MRNKRLREWASTEDGEGLHELIESTQHGLQILEYSDESQADGADGFNRSESMIEESSG